MIDDFVRFSTSRREGVNVTESTVSQQLSLSIGDDSLGSWSNLSFEEDHPDESSSFHHLSDRWASPTTLYKQYMANLNMKWSIVSRLPHSSSVCFLFLCTFHKHVAEKYNLAN